MDIASSSISSSSKNVSFGFWAQAVVVLSFPYLGLFVIYIHTHNSVNAPLISYGTPVSQPPPYYGGAGTAARFKPYVDPSTYDDPNQALAEFTLEIPPDAVYITTIIGGGEFGDVCMGNLRKSVVDSRYNGYDEVGKFLAGWMIVFSWKPWPSRP